MENRYQKLIQHDAVHPLEFEVVHLVANFLEKVEYPIERVAVSILFGFRTTASANSLDIRTQGNVLVGSIKLMFNSLFIHQNCNEFYTHVVPHEVAHMLAESNAFKRGQKIKVHGPEWAQWLATLSHEAVPEAGRAEQSFDDRAIKLHQGGIPSRCMCNDDNLSFHVVSARQKKKMSSGLRCNKCKEFIKPIDISETPRALADQVDYIRDRLRQV